MRFTRPDSLPFDLSPLKVSTKLDSHLSGLSLALEALTSHHQGRLITSVLQDAGRLDSELSHLGHHTLWMASIFVLRKLFHGEIAPLRSLSEPREQERIGRQAEESILGLLAILVHGLTDDGEINQWVSQEVIVLVVAVREHKQLQQLNELEASLLSQGVQKPREALIGEVHQRLEHGKPALLSLLLGLPLVKERLVSQLVVKGHRSEASPLEEEIKVLIVVAITLPRPL